MVKKNKANRLLFGTAGTPVSAGARTTEAGIDRIIELGLDCMEVEFVHGVRMSTDKALIVKELAVKKGVILTAHGPYYINLNAVEPEKINASKERIIHTARIASALGAISITFHAAFYLGKPPVETYANVREHLGDILNVLRIEGNTVMIRPEVTGKPTQFGSLEELLRLSADLDGIAPCIDFSHMHARTGEYNSYTEFVSILDQVEQKISRQGLENMHIHVSGIEYGKKGELKHLMLKDSDFKYRDLLRALKERDAKGVVICESPVMEDDALLLQRTYNEL